MRPPKKATGTATAAPTAPAGKAANLRRLRRIEGQVRGLQKMVEEERYCADIMTQIASVHEALRAVGREVVRGHVRDCVESEGKEEMVGELVEMMYRLGK